MSRLLAPLLATFALAGAAATHAAPFPVTPADASVIKKAIAAQKGHVVVVNFWATWCGPCVAEFPELVTTARKFALRNFEFLTISADDPKEIAKVKSFLEKRGAGLSDRQKKTVASDGRTTNSYLYNGNSTDDLMKALDPEWPGGIPHTVLIGTSGEILWRHNGAIDGEELRAKVLEVMGGYYQPGEK